VYILNLAIHRAGLVYSIVLLLYANDRFARSIDLAARSVDLLVAQASVDLAKQSSRTYGLYLGYSRSCNHLIDRSCSASSESVAGFVDGALPDMQLFLPQFLRMFTI